MVLVPPAPTIRLALGVTGHREGNAGFAANRAAIITQLEAILALVDDAARAEEPNLGGLSPPRIHTLLADGTDQIAFDLAEKLTWEIVAPLPFGKQLNLAINSFPGTVEDVQALLAGRQPADPECARHAAAITQRYERARLFELADQDDELQGLLLTTLADPADTASARLLHAHASVQVALAGRVMIEQSDLLIAVWDGRSANLAGGTGHTIAAALERGCAVVRIDPARPEGWHILHAPESLAAPPGVEDREAALSEIVRNALRPGEGGALKAGAESLASEAWHGRSSALWTAYRRIEALFGGEGRPFRSLIATYEAPEDIAEGRGREVLTCARALPGGDPGMPDRIEREVLQRYAWADGISARLSDSYRGGMTTSFILSSLAIVCGIAYTPFAGPDSKWLFASGEFILLAAILLIIWRGERLRWHKRWFETRRVAEYFRHAPIMLLLGVARPAGRWPQGTDTSWPEYYSRHALRGPGLPAVAVTREYLRYGARHLLDAHVIAQRDYHFAKSRRLNRVHHRLDRLSERLFQAAIISVSAYLITVGFHAFGLVWDEAFHLAGKYATFLGVMFPTFGAGLAGIRYFGDFERFAAISQVTAEKLDGVHARIELLLSAPEDAISYAQVAELAHAADDIVVSEIENWQAVFGGKHISVPV